MTTDKHWRQNAEEATTRIEAVLESTRAALRASNVSLATAFAVARRNGDLLETANLTRTPLVQAEKFALWADLAIIGSGGERPNAARARADAQTDRIPTGELPTPPGAVVIARAIHYAQLRGINVNGLILDKIGPIGPDPSLSTIQAYADALDVPIAALVTGRVDDEPLPV